MAPRLRSPYNPPDRFASSHQNPTKSLFIRFGGTRRMATMTKERKPTKTQLKLQPLGDRVVVRREESEERTAGGIVLPDAAKEKPTRGIIEAVGNGKLLDDGTRGKLQVKAGDRVLFSAWGGENFKVGDEELLLLKEDDILAVLDD